MKLFYLITLCVLTMIFAFTSNIFSQTAITTVAYSGFQACGGCTVCGADYWCINTPGSYCGNTAACDSKSFFDPVPPGHIVTNVTINYWSASCEGASINGSINGYSVPITYDGNTGCWCSDNPCSLATSSTGSTPCGMPGYVYGGNNILQICASGAMCINRAELIFTYVDPDVITPSIIPSGSLNICQGGSVDLNATSGYSSYRWNTGATSQSITATNSGVYTVSVTSITGCTTGSSSVTVSVSPTVFISATATPSSICNGQCTTLNASGATSYTWMPGNLSGSSVNVCPSVSTLYLITGTDNLGCTNTNSIVVNVNPLPNVMISGTNAICTGSNTILTALGANNYSWNTGASTNSINVSPTIPTTYSVTGTDVNGCVNYTSVPISIFSNPIGNISGITPVCPYSSETYTNIGNTFSIINWTVSGGNITSGQGTSAIDVDWGNFGFGVVSFTGTDGNGCTSVSPAIYNVAINAQLSVTLTLHDSVCIDAPSYTLSGGLPLGGIYSGNGVIGGVFNPALAGAGSHTITYSYTDANSCTNSSSSGIIVVSALPVLTFPPLQSVCGNDTSFIFNTATPIGGTYSGVGVLGNTFSPSTAGVGLHTITYTYTNTVTHCVNSITQPITVYPVPVAYAGRDTMICYGANYTLQASGAGVGGGYLWDDGSTNPSRIISNLTIGTIYSVTATNSDGCSTSDMVILHVNPELNISFTQINASCFGFNNGSATAVVTGGAFPYTYLWSNTQITNPAVNLSSGNYTVVVTDNSYIHCTISGSVTITQPTAAMSVVIDSTLISCNGVSDGSINTTVSGGTSPYTYLWSNGLTTPSLSNIPSGIYTVTITDFQACRLIRSINISQPNPLIIVIDSSNVSCNGANDGWIRANVSGGTTLYRYLWNNGATGNMISNLLPGTYSVVVTDAHNCISMRQITITEPLPLQSNSYSTDVRCFGFNDGSAYVVARGGTLPYSYLWSNGSVNDSISLLSPNSYTVIITDAHNCTTPNSVTINEPPLLTTLVDSVNILCNGSATGYIAVTPSGGISPYTYLWNNGSNNNIINNINAGLYIVTITDFNQCILVRNITLTEPAALLIDMIVNNESCIEYCNGSIYAEAQGGVRPYSYIWDTNPLQIDSIANNLCVGTYTVKVIDFNNCFNLATSSIVTRTLTTATFIATPTEGSIPLTVSFTYTGSMASSYLWNFGDGNYSTVPNPTHTYITDSVFTASLTVISNTPDLCHDTYGSQILIYPVSTLYVPNAFTPNSDDVNDRFYVRAHAIKSIEVYIFDRWGKLIHEMHSMEDYWDGTINGEMAPQGVYVYSIRAKGYDDVNYRKMGRVTLVIK